MARKPTPAGAAASTPAAATTIVAGDNAASGTDTSSSTGEKTGGGDNQPESDPAATPPAGDVAAAQPADEKATPAPASDTADAGGNAPTSSDVSSEPEVEVGTIEVRILLDHGDHRPNDVALLTPSDLKFAITAGWADPDPEAIAFAKSLVA